MKKKVFQNRKAKTSDLTVTIMLEALIDIGKLREVLKFRTTALIKLETRLISLAHRLKYTGDTHTKQVKRIHNLYMNERNFCMRAGEVINTFLTLSEKGLMDEDVCINTVNNNGYVHATIMGRFFVVAGYINALHLLHDKCIDERMERAVIATINTTRDDVTQSKSSLHDFMKLTLCSGGLDLKRIHSHREFMKFGSELYLKEQSRGELNEKEI